MKIYNITVGQLIILWIIGVLGAFWLFMSSSDWGSENNFYYSIVVIFALIFYSIGWKNRKKEDK